MSPQKPQLPFNMSEIIKKASRLYRESLSAQKIVDGMNAAHRNARRLVADAKRMLDSSRYPTAAALAILAIEERGKMNILPYFAVTKDKTKIKNLWNALKDHEEKNSNWITPGLLKEGHHAFDILSSLTDPKAEHPKLLEKFKQLSLYIDCLENAQWHEPEKEIGKEVASWLVNLADSMTISPTITLKEIELFIEHLKPLCDSPVKRSAKDLAEAMFNWRNAMAEEGLIKKGNDVISDHYRELIESFQKIENEKRMRMK